MSESPDGNKLDFLRSIQSSLTTRCGNDPTRTVYFELVQAYDFFNDRLFCNTLPRCLITLQRGRTHYGYFCGGRFGSIDGREITDEIAINPQYLRGRSTDENLSTFVHEMCHLRQHHFGKPSRNGYHNKPWADDMDAVGLPPSDTGKPGGKRTGQRVSHYILEGGPFDIACRELVSQGFSFKYADLAGLSAPDNEDDEHESQPEKPDPKRKSKYACPDDELKVYGQPGRKVVCGYCGLAMIESRL